jgi:hypothetical protein
MISLLRTSLFVHLFSVSLALGNTTVRRQSSNTDNTIDSATMTDCNHFFCVGLGSILGHTPACPSTDGKWTKDRYCKLKTPLKCAWICIWDSWMLAEDWYTDVCGPDADQIAYNNLPACARDCLPGALFDAGCITQGRNCFCSNGDMLGCHGTCTDQEKVKIGPWLADQCNITDTLARQGAINGTCRDKTSSEQDLLSLVGKYSGKTGKEVVYIAPSIQQKLRWYEVWAIIILCLTALATLVGWRTLGVLGHEKPAPLSTNVGTLPR